MNPFLKKYVDVFVVYKICTSSFKANIQTKRQKSAYYNIKQKLQQAINC